jgi:hypothetical protein
VKPHAAALERYAHVSDMRQRIMLAARDTVIVELDILHKATDLLPEHKIERLIEITQMMLDYHVIPRPA